MYVYRNAGDIEWMCGSSSNAEDLCEMVCRIVSQSGLDLEQRDIENIRNRLGLDMKIPEELDDKNGDRK